MNLLIGVYVVVYNAIMSQIFLDKAFVLSREIKLPNSKFVAISNFYFLSRNFLIENEIQYCVKTDKNKTNEWL